MTTFSLILDSYFDQNWRRRHLSRILYLRANVGKYRESQISYKNSNFGWYHPNIPLGELFQEMILRNPQALYILRILEKFENSQKIHFFNSENGCKFQQISTKQYKRAKAPIDLILLMYLADIHSFKTA